MKRYIRASEIPTDVLNQAVYHAKSSGDRGTIIDLDNHLMVIPFSSGTTKEDLFEEGMLGDWFIQNGFKVDTEVRDFEYSTKGTFNPRSMTRYNAGNKRYLKNRVVLTITW